MCRLAFIPAKAKVTRKALRQLFESLEMSCGGDGNGYAAIRTDGSSHVSAKGLKLDSAEIAKQAYQLTRDNYHFYYHTRLVSVGERVDTQCHPFRFNGKSASGHLCHNGTWHDGASIARYLNVGSDTAALACCIGKFGLPGAIRRKLFPSSGVVMLNLFRDNSHTVHYQSGDLEYCKTSGVYASEFNYYWPSWDNVEYVAHGEHNLLLAPKYAERKESKLSFPKSSAAKTCPRYDMSSTRVERNLLGF